jgi:thiol-disulfide isomerase/thioredoxin
MKKDQKLKALLFFVALFAVLFWFSMPQGNEPAAKQKDKAQQTQKVNDEQTLPEAPLFTLENLDGDKVSLKDYRGKIVFVNFWATWCGPCRMEIPHFVKLSDKYEEDLVILGISVDNPKDYDKIPDFSSNYNINYPILLDKRGEANYLYGGIQSIPTTFVLDREGKALGRIVGARSYEQFDDLVKEIM